MQYCSYHVPLCIKSKQQERTELTGVLSEQPNLQLMLQYHPQEHPSREAVPRPSVNSLL